MDLHFYRDLNLKRRSDLDLLNSELTFLQQFLKTNFATMFSDLAVSRVQLLYDRLVELKFTYEDTINSLESHQNNLCSKDFDFLKLESESIGERLNNLNSTFNRLKEYIFAYYKESIKRNLSVVEKELQFA